MENKTGSLPAPSKAPNTWIAYVQKVSGASYQHTSGAEAKTFLGYSHATHVGLKSELSAGGFFKNIVGPDFSMQFAPLVGGKKDKSWGDKREWRKGDISLRCIGKKEDFVFSSGEWTQFGASGSFVLAKQERTQADKEKITNLDLKEEILTQHEVYNQNYEELTTKLREMSAQKLSIAASKSASIIANKLDIGADAALSLSGARIKMSAPSVKIIGKSDIGGVSVPNPSIAAQLAKLRARIVYQEKAILALHAKAIAKRAQAASMILPA